MALYFFDVHDSGTALWDDQGLECADRNEIVAQVRRLFGEAADRHTASGTVSVTTSAFVHLDGSKIILTAIAKPGEEVRFVWVAE